MSNSAPRAIGLPLNRLDGPAKVTGRATYAYEHPVDRPAYLYLVQATIAHGHITHIDTSAASAEPGVLLVITHINAPKLAASFPPELAILQSEEIAYRGQIVGGVIAETIEIARHAASLVRLNYEERAHDAELRPDRSDLRPPQQAQAHPETQTDQSDIDAALASAAVTVDVTYTTPMYHHHPMEPHSTIATWTDDGLTIYCSSQGVHRAKALIAPMFGLDAQRVRVISPHVGGGFGSKVWPHPDVVLAVMAARLIPNRPVKCALTRQQMFSQVGYRSPTIQRIRLGADADGHLCAVSHDAIEQTAKIMEFVENSSRSTRTMYAAPQQRTTQLLATLDVPVPSIMRGPGEAPGMFALESAIDEMAFACGLDPIEFRIRNEPDVEPASGLPFSGRQMVTCLREGARLFGWEQRDPSPRTRREGSWLVGTGVATSIYPVFRLPGNAATIRVGPDVRYAVLIGAADIGTGTWTALTQIAADALEVAVEDIDLQIGDSALPIASSAGGSSGIISWGTAIVEAARKLRELLRRNYGGTMPAEGFEVTAEMPDNPFRQQFAMYSFGAQFAEVRVNVDTGEVRVPRLLGMFDVGRVINAKTARSQLLGGMTMGLSMALHENSVLDPRFGHVVNQDFAEYHIATNADVGTVEVHWLDGEDPYASPLGTRGIGEIGIVGTAAAIANAAYHATGIRVRDLPITLDKFLR
jgi:xanthine dehydrogenase YagR molybdenum-binding subunit